MNDAIYSGNNEVVPLGQHEEFSVKIHTAYKDDQSGALLRNDLVLKSWTSCFLSREINVNNCDQLSDCVKSMAMVSQSFTLVSSNYIMWPRVTNLFLLCFMNALRSSGWTVFRRFETDYHSYLLFLQIDRCEASTIVRTYTTQMHNLYLRTFTSMICYDLQNELNPMWSNYNNSTLSFIHLFFTINSS